MRILVYGAGVLGCNIARRLFRAGNDVTLLACGKWAEEIKKNGLRIKDKFSLRVSVSRVSTVTELTPNDVYDVIFVAVRYTQIRLSVHCAQTNRKTSFLSATMFTQRRLPHACRIKM